MKMYIFIKDSVPDNFAPVVAAHASLACYLAFKDDPEMKAWLAESFRKVTCLVSDAEYKLAKKSGQYVEFIEDDLDDMPLALAFKPRKSFPCYFNGFKLYS